MLVIDRSGSMAGQRITDAKTAAGELVQLLNLPQAQHQAGLVTFESSATLDHPLTQDEASLLAAINAISAIGGTDMAAGITLAHTELITNDPRPEARPVIVLLVDDGSAQDAVTAAESAKADGLRIIVVGIDIGLTSESVLKNQITSSPEDYYPAADSGQLNAIYTSRPERPNITMPPTNGLLLATTPPCATYWSTTWVQPSRWWMKMGR